EIGPATDFVHLIKRLVGSLLEARRGRNREVAARRKSHHADPLRMDAPLAGFAPDQADGALGILERAARRLSLGFIGVAGNAVLEDDAGDANRVQPGGDFLALKLPVEVPVPASWTNQHRGSRLLIPGWPIDR